MSFSEPRASIFLLLTLVCVFMFTESISITPGDARWVGAWWLGYLIAGLITLFSAVPFWFLPKSLPLPERRLAKYSPEGTSFIKDSPLLEHKYQADEPTNLLEMAKGEQNQFQVTFTHAQKDRSENFRYSEDEHEFVYRSRIDGFMGRTHMAQSNITIYFIFCLYSYSYFGVYSLHQSK